MVVVVLVGGVALLECCCDACVCVWVLLSGMHSGGGFCLLQAFNSVAVCDSLFVGDLFVLACLLSLI